MAITEQDIKNSYTMLTRQPDGVSKDTVVAHYCSRGFGSITSDSWTQNYLHEVDGRFYYSHVSFKYSADITTKTGEAYDDVIRACPATVTGRIEGCLMQWYEVHDLKAFRRVVYAGGNIPYNAREIVNEYRNNGKSRYHAQNLWRDNKLLHA